MRLRPIAVALASLLAACAADTDPPAAPDHLRVNHLQAIGTHNSYHVLDGPPALAEYDYVHRPLAEQLDLGVRQFELDVHYHPKDDRFEVYHIPGADEASSCRLFADCLAAIRGWSEAHPEHHPILVLLEPKDEFARIAAEVGALDDIDEGLMTGHYDQLDAAIRAGIPDTMRFEPDDLRGDHATVRAALDAEGGWPLLSAVRGRVIFALLNHGDERAEYLGEAKDLVGRAMFAFGDPTDAWAAVTAYDDPIGDADRIAAAVTSGMLVRTRADTGDEAPANDTTRRDAAIASGAHFLSSDFPTPHPDSGYVIEIPGGTPSGCNPVTAPSDCTGPDIEDLGVAATQ